MYPIMEMFTFLKLQKHNAMFLECLNFQGNI